MTPKGKFHTTTHQHTVGVGATWGMFWGFLFGLIFFVPLFGLAVGAGLGALFGKIEKTGIDKEFQNQVREMLKPGTSALFLIVEKVTRQGGRRAQQVRRHVLKTSLSKEAEEEPSASCTASRPRPSRSAFDGRSVLRFVAEGARPVEAPDLPGLFEVPYTTAKGTCSASRAHAISSQQSRRLSHVARSASGRELAHGSSSARTVPMRRQTTLIRNVSA